MVQQEDEGKVLSFTVEDEQEGERVDNLLASLLFEHSRSYIQKLIREGRIQAEGRTIKANHRVEEGEALTIFLPKPVELEILPQDIPLDILYEDEDLLVVNKPKGMVVHPAPGHYRDTLVNALLLHCKGELSGINGVLRPGIVHRIDRDTTGSLVVCKTDGAHRFLADQLKAHSITRDYIAIVYGRIKEDGTVHAPIGRHPTDRKRMAILPERGREAITHYRVLEDLGDWTYIGCSLETGRTHQIRVHMASIHHPLLGDPLYGPQKPSIKHLQGQTLHARLLGFIHPRTGEYMEFEAPLPVYFRELLERLRSR